MQCCKGELLSVNVNVPFKRLDRRVDDRLLSGDKRDIITTNFLTQFTLSTNAFSLAFVDDEQNRNNRMVAANYGEQNQVRELESLQRIVERTAG